MNRRALASIASVIALSSAGWASAATAAPASHHPTEVQILRSIHRNPERVPNRSYTFNKGTKIYARPWATSRVTKEIRRHATLRVTPGPVYVDGTTKFLGFSFTSTKNNKNLRQLAHEEVWVKRSDASGVKTRSGPPHVTIKITSHGYVWSPDTTRVNQGTVRA